MQHKNATLNHKIENWTYPNAAARTGATGMVIEDVGKIAFQTSDNTYWRLLTHSPLAWVQLGSAGGGGGGILGYVLIRDEKPAGTVGGGFTNGAWRTRTLNTEVSDVGNLATLASNQIILLPGTYIVNITAPAAFVDRHTVKLFNVTTGLDEIIGMAAYAGVAGAGNSVSICSGRIFLAAPSVFEVRHRCQSTSPTYGFGTEGNFGVTEVYTTFEAWKVG